MGHDWDAIEKALAEKIKGHEDHYMAKFFRTPKRWYDEAVRIAKLIGLDSPQPEGVYDLGCGLGYFLLACHDIGGHPVAGLDAGDPVLGDGLATIVTTLDWGFTPHTIGAYQPLPTTWSAASLLTMFGVNLRGVCGNYFTDDEWRWFLDNLFVVPRSAASSMSRFPNTRFRFICRPNVTSANGPGQPQLGELDWWASVLPKGWAAEKLDDRGPPHITVRKT